MYLRTGCASLVLGRGMPPPPPEVALGRGRPLRGGARDRTGVEFPELGLDVAFTGCLRASGEGMAGERSLLGDGTGRESTGRFNYTHLHAYIYSIFIILILYM